MGRTIIHTTSKEYIARTGKRKTTGQYGPKIRNDDYNKDYYDRVLHWTTDKGEQVNRQQLLGNQGETVERLIILLRKTLDSQKTPHGLSLNSAVLVAREAGFKGYEELTEAVDIAGACLVDRMPQEYTFKGDLVLARTRRVVQKAKRGKKF